MFTSSYRALALAALACACLLAACGDDAPPPKAAAPVATAPAPKVAHLSGTMVAAVSSGKTASAIGVHFALGASPVIGKALPVEIAIVPHRKFATVSAHFESHDGVTVTTGENFGPNTDAESETALTHHLVLMPSKEGLFMVTASVDTESDEGNVTRIFSIPVIVGLAQGVAPAPTRPENPHPAPAEPAAK